MQDLETSKESIEENRHVFEMDGNRSGLPLRCYKNTFKQIHRYLLNVLLVVTNFAAVWPIQFLTIIPPVSIAILVLGFSTNYNVKTDKVALWTPNGSKALEQGDWVHSNDVVPNTTYPIGVLIHSKGNDTLNKKGLDRSFQVLKTFQETQGYDEFCSSTQTDLSRCHFHGISNIFDNNYTIFSESVSDDKDAKFAAATVLGRPDQKVFLGHATYTPDGIVKSSQSLYMTIEIPLEKGSYTFERKIMKNLLALRERWKQSNFFLEISSTRAYNDELERAVGKDVPLLPVVFIVMTLFSSAVYFKRDRVRSSCLCLGIGAVATVCLSLIASFGFLFIVGIPFNQLTMMLPFIIMGIGLDDAFILTGSFDRTDKSLSTEERVRLAVLDCGASIIATTLTTAAAFWLGMTSTVPAIRGFYIYAGPCVLIDFLYQVTFFIALISINERRIHEDRQDCCICFKNPSMNQNDEYQDDPFSRIVMRKYGYFLSNSKVFQVMVIAIFTGLTVFLGHRCTKLKVNFDTTDVLASDSFVLSFVKASNQYSDTEPYHTRVFFRDIDFSDPAMRLEMTHYVSELVDLKYVQIKPNFWVEDFENFVKEKGQSQLHFEEQIDLFLDNDLFKKHYSDQIIRTKEGQVIASTVLLALHNIDIDAARSQVNFLFAQRKVSSNQVINKKSKRWAFFTFTDFYYIWEFFAVATKELIMTTILGIAAVVVFSFLFIPHPSGFLFIAPTVIMIYADVLGVMHLCGLTINPVTYISLIMSIGLMVDYVFHIVLRYFESQELTRKGKVVDVLSTMGVSILIGGISTILGSVPLSFSQSEIFFSVFIVFFSFVVLSLAHGLLFVPVVLSLCGPVGETANEILFMSNVRKDTGSTDELETIDY